MAFQFFSQMQGPTIPIDLYQRADAAGIAAGNAQKTTTQAIVEGLTTGIETGQNIAIKQNQINQQPVANAIQQEQLEQEQWQNEIRALQVREAKATEDLRLQVTRADLQNKVQLLEQKNQDLKTEAQLMSDLTSGDPFVQKSILNNKQYTGYMLRNPEIAEDVLGKLSNDNVLSPEEQKRALLLIDFSKAQQYRHELDKLTAAGIQKQVEDGDKKLGGFLNNPEYADLVAKYPSATEALKAIKIVPRGTYTLNEAGEVDTKAPPKAQSDMDAGEFDLLENNKLVRRLKGSKGAEDYNMASSFLQTAEGVAYEAVYNQKRGRGQQQPQPAPAPAPAPNQPPQAPPNTIESLGERLQREQGIAPADSAALLGQAAERGRTEWFSQYKTALSDILPPFVADDIQRTAFKDMDESQTTQDARALINKTAGELASKTLSKLNTGTVEDKKEVRTWAEAAGVSLNYNSLKNHFAGSVREALTDAYTDAYDVGVAEKAAAARADTQKDAIKRDAELLLLQRSSQRIASPSTAEAAAPAVAEKSAADTSAFLNQSPKTSKAVEAVVKRVATSPYLKDQPVYVQALAAQESKGRTDAVSPTGVRGLLQVTKRTASKYPGLSRDVPEDSVAMGRAYIEELRDMFNGNAALAYAAYNAGPGATALAQKMAGGSEDWRVVKQYMLAALKRFANDLHPVTPAEKFKEVYNYPESVLMYENILSGYG